MSKFTSKSVLLGHWPPGLFLPQGGASGMAHCWVWVALLHGLDGPLLGRASQRAWQGYTVQRVWSMAIGPVWEAMIHVTSCHLPPLPACSPSAAAQLLSLLKSIFRAGWFLPSKTGKRVVKQEGVVFFFLFFFLSFLDILLWAVGQYVHVSHTLASLY